MKRPLGRPIIIRNEKEKEAQSKKRRLQVQLNTREYRRRIRERKLDLKLAISLNPSKKCLKSHLKILLKTTTKTNIQSYISQPISDTFHAKRAQATDEQKLQDKLDGCKDDQEDLDENAVKLTKRITSKKSRCDVNTTERIAPKKLKWKPSTGINLMVCFFVTLFT